MIKYLKEYRFYITLFLFLLIPVIAIDTSTRAPRDFKIHDQIVIAITAPIQGIISWTLDHLVMGFQNYIYLLGTRDENVTLLDENRKLLNIISNLKETEQENIRLRRLLQFQEKFNLKTVVARVIAKDVSTEFRTIRINRGENAGIRKDMAVITNEGTVGRILRTTRNSADIVTVLDMLSAVDAIVERSRARGIVEGLTDEICVLRYTLRTDDVQLGDILITSGLGGIFPKGIPIGVVSKVNRKAFGITQEIEIHPNVDFTKLEEVLVVTNLKDDPLAELAHGDLTGKENSP